MNEQFHERIVNPEKAHAMALAGDEERTDAVNARKAAKLYEGLIRDNDFDDETDPDGSLKEEQKERLEGLREEAETRDVLAELEEEQAGREFDSQTK